MIVNMSPISARRDAKTHAAHEHWLAERVLDWSGVPVIVHLRPTFFAEWLFYHSATIREKGVLALPLDPAARHAPVTAEDQARVIAAILEDPLPHRGQIYPLYGPTEYTQPEVAEILSSVLGKKIPSVGFDYDPRRDAAAKDREANQNPDSISANAF